MTTERATTTTILFTDLVDSTELMQRAGDEEAQRIQRAHYRLLRDALARHGGHEVKATGDGLMVAFSSAADAVACAIAMQQAARQPAAGERLRIRVGLNAGEALRDEEDYFGTPVVVARRLCDLAEAGQILCSRIVVSLLSGRQSFDFADRGELALKGIAAPVATCEVRYDPLDPAALLQRTPFVGRSAEMAQLEAKLRAARDGHGGLAMLVGEPGIGKTRTAEEFCAQARADGVAVLWGRCYDGEWSPPFSPFVEAIREHARRLEPDVLREQLAYGAPVLARLVPAVRERLPDLPDPPALQPDDERYRLLDAVSELLGAACVAAPLLLVLDDLHWADKGTIAMLRHVARNAAGQRLLVLGLYRDVELNRQHPLAAALADLRREPGYERVALKGLARSDVGALLDIFAERDVPEPLVTAISDETDGNPFFIREVLRNLIDEGSVYQEDGRWTTRISIADMGIPEGVREVIGRRVSRLSEVCGRMLTVASTMTGGCSWEVLLATTGEPEAALVDAVDEAVGAQIIEERRDGASVRYEFTHALIRHTLYEELSTARRVLLHRQIGVALEALYAGNVDAHVSDLAHHFCEAAPGGDAEKAIDHGRRAGERALALAAYDEAASHFGRTLEALELTPGRSEAQRLELLLSLGESQWKSGEASLATLTYAAAADVARALGDAPGLGRAALGYRHAYGIAPAGDAFRNSEWAAALFASGGVVYEEGRWPSGPGTWETSVALLREALASLGERDVSLRASLMARLSAIAPDATERAELATQAMTLARSVDDAALQADVLYRSNRLESGIEEQLVDATEMVELAEKAGRRDLLWYGQMWRTAALIRLGRFAEADVGIPILAKIADELRAPLFVWLPQLFSATRAMMKGRLGEAELFAAQALASGQKAQAGESVTFFGYQTVEIRRQQGRLGELDPLMQSIIDQFPDAADAAIAFPAHCGLALVLAATGGEAARLAKEVDEVGRDDFTMLRNAIDAPLFAAIFAEVFSVTQDSLRAATIYEILRPFDGRIITAAHPVVCLGAAAHYLGMLASTMGHFEDAERHFTEGLALNQRIDAPPYVAYTRYEYAKMLAARAAAGDRERAVGLVDDALVTAREVGMARLIEQAEELRKSVVD